ncbi:unnamed protein product [Dovyalis caffra]|uniref:Uncharacterized protein n=1 Tax=Dovyalis caffra TaxID=77055 RepID=A0AAV1RAG8_9ROSI|nr:unnamed protein product [Dovyalis caffra]
MEKVSSKSSDVSMLGSKQAGTSVNDLNTEELVELPRSFKEKCRLSRITKDSKKDGGYVGVLGASWFGEVGVVWFSNVVGGGSGGVILGVGGGVSI